MGDSFQFYLDLLLIWLLLIDVCVLAANVINRYTKEPSRYGERSFMRYCVAALVALFVAVVLYSALHPEVRRPIIGIDQFFSLLDKSVPVSHLTITIAAICCALIPFVRLVKKLQRSQLKERATRDYQAKKIKALEANVRILKSQLKSNNRKLKALEYLAEKHGIPVNEIDEITNNSGTKKAENFLTLKVRNSTLIDFFHL